MEVLQPLTPWKMTNSVKLEKSITHLYPRGGTELAKALTSARDMYFNAKEMVNGSNRIMFMTGTVNENIWVK